MGEIADAILNDMACEGDGDPAQLQEPYCPPGRERAHELRCPSCGRPARRTETRYGRRDDCAGCGLWSWGGKPLVSEKTHGARQMAHVALDALWANREERSNVYAWLSHEMGLPADKTHISLMTATQCRMVLSLCMRRLLVGG